MSSSSSFCSLLLSCICVARQHSLHQQSEVSKHHNHALLTCIHVVLPGNTACTRSQKQASSSSCFADLYPCCVARRHSLHRESEESFIHTSLEAVEGYMSAVIDSIVHSVPACPLALRIVLRNIYLKARLKWPHESHEVGQLLLVMLLLLLSWSCASCCATSTSRPASSGLMNSMRWVGCCW